MYSRGHVGLGLLAYAPAAAVALGAGETRLALLGGLLAVAFATLPDADHRLPIAHRGVTHTLPFALAVGGLAWLTAGAVAAVAPGATAGFPPWTPAYVGVVATATLCSHLVGDAITPMGVRPFSPSAADGFTLGLTPARNPTANRALLAAGVLAVSVVAAVARPI